MSDQILIVDDDPGVLAVCRRILDNAGYHTTTASLPQDALRLLRQHRFDLMLVDIRLPEMGGFELMQLARERDPELATVIITGHGTIDTVVEALEHGAEGLVLKPFISGPHLVQRVQEALVKSRQAREAARSRALRPLFEVSQLLLSEIDSERLRQQIVKSVQGQFGTSCVGLYELNGDSLRLIAGQQSSTHSCPPDMPVGVEAGLPGRSVAWLLPLWVTQEVPGDAALLSDLTLMNVGSALCAPLARRGQPMGAIVAGKAAEAGTFREGDLELLTILAGQAAVAMENANLYAELRDSMRQLQDSRDRLIQAEKFAAQGRLLGSIAHEVNNPLQAIQNCLHLAEHEGLSDDKRRSYHQLAAEEVERLIGTVRHMLDYYRPASTDFVPTDVNGLLDEVLLLAAKQLSDNGVQIKKHYRKNLPAVPAMGNNLKQVFLNLMLNASEAMPNGGVLTLSTTVQRDGGRSLVLIAIADTGAGIAPGDQAKLFEPFFTTKQGGTGLGLSVSYGIVEAHGGWMSARSAPGEGTTFNVYLPLERTSNDGDGDTPNTGR